ncbi:MAG: restriction endonuclease subunit S [Clostridia bacterium]
MNPMGWEQKSLLEIGSCKNGLNFSANEEGKTIKYLGVGDFKELTIINDISKLKEIELKELPSEEYILKDGDIVFVRSNGNKNLVGRCLAIYPNNEPTTFSGFCIRFRKNTDKIEISYLLQVLKTKSIRKKMAGRGANIQNLNQQILSNLSITLPPLAIQTQFADFVAQVDKSKFYQHVENFISYLKYHKEIKPCQTSIFY